MNTLRSYLSPVRHESKKASKSTPGEAHIKKVDDHVTVNSTFGEFPSDELNDARCEMMADFLHSQQEENRWITNGGEEGVVLKKSQGAYTCSPPNLAEEPALFYRAVEALNVRVAMTVNTPMIKILLAANKFSSIEIRPGLRLQVLDDLIDLPRCQKHQSAAFIANRGVMVVWQDDPNTLLAKTADLEEAIMNVLWNDEPTEVDDKIPEKKDRAVCDIQEIDPESQSSISKRPIVLIQPCLVALTLTLCLSALGSGWRQISLEIKVDGSCIRAALAATAIPQLWLMLFFFQALTGNVAQLLGPMKQTEINSKFYSGRVPTRLPRQHGALPHVTIQIPVYKEGLWTVIEPTVRSLKAAMCTYELQGGTCNIFVNDDGMQLIDEEQARQRQEFYDEHNIGWVARPKHNPKPVEREEPFLRRGKFKKASNMNYGLWISSRVEDKLARNRHAMDRRATNRHSQFDQMTSLEEQQQEKKDACGQALNEVVAEDNGRTWAAGNVRIGDYILLVDSDTRVPDDCLLDAVSEMEQCPEVAILQYSSGVMNVTDSYFEKGITFFTNLVYTQIEYAVANGDVAPFVGHNAVLRWSAVQEIGYHCKLDNRDKWWSEATVSEDFDMALRLQTEGYMVRLGAYTGGQFKEGVSLTVYDELARWEKYAYGCSELIFHPFRYWPTRGPFTPLFRRFICSRFPLPGKFTIMAYVGTYYALGIAWVMTLANYLLVGWYNGYLDKYYVDSFKIYVAIIAVFTVLGNVALAILRYRLGKASILGALLENIRWVPLLIVFLGGVSLHVSQALLSHLFSVDMTWGATAKEVENITFFEEIPRVFKRFKVTFVLCVAAAVAMTYLGVFATPFWQIRTFICIWPLATLIGCHVLLPIALNPNLMLFKW